LAKSSGLTGIGNLLAVVGGIIMVIFGILAIVGTVVNSFNEALVQLNFQIYRVSNDSLVGGIITLVIGIVLIYIYKEKHANAGDELLIYGIIYIVLGFLGGSLGGLLAIIGGILLIIDFFL